MSDPSSVIVAEPARSVRLDIPYNIRQIAKLADWRTPEARARLKQLDRENGGKVLHRIGSRYYTTLAELRVYWPDFAKRTASNGDVAAVEEDVGELRKLVRHQAFELRELRRRVRELESKVP